MKMMGKKESKSMSKNKMADKKKAMKSGKPMKKAKNY